MSQSHQPAGPSYLYKIGKIIFNAGSIAAKTTNLQSEMYQPRGEQHYFKRHVHQFSRIFQNEVCVHDQGRNFKQEMHTRSLATKHENESRRKKQSNELASY